MGVALETRMYTETFPTIRTSPSIVPVRVAATAAFALMGITHLVGGTGSVFDVTRAGEWRRLVEARTPIHVEIEVDGEEAVRPDLRSASEHLANIREVLSPAIADLAGTFGVSRQAIYKWLGAESTPEADNFARIQALSQVADAFREAGVKRAPMMLKMKAFDGRSLLDLIAANQNVMEHVQTLISEAQAMDAAYERSGLAKSKAAPTDDWRSAASIPGYPEQ